MSYEYLKERFDSLAQEVVVFGTTLSPTERNSSIQELCILAGRIALHIKGHADESRILRNLDSLLHRAHSAANALEQCESLREKTLRNYMEGMQVEKS